MNRKFINTINLEVYVSFLTAILFVVSRMCGQVHFNSHLFDHYGSKQGFFQTQAIAMAKTSNGILWIGTEGGLVKYDGQHFENVLYQPPKNERSYSNYVKYLCKDKYNRLWMDIDDRLCIYDAAKDTFYHPNINGKMSEYSRFKFHYDESNDVMYIATADGILQNRGREIRPSKIEIKNLKNEFIQDLTLDGKNNLWFVNDNGLYKYNLHLKSLEQFHRKDAQKDESDDFNSIYIDEENIIWIGCWTKGLIGFNPDTKDQHRFTWHDEKLFQNGIISISVSGIEGDEDNLWLASTSGIITFNRRSFSFKEYFNDDVSNDYNIPGAGLAFCKTKTEGLWIGTTKGLYKFDALKQSIQLSTLNIPSKYKKYLVGKVEFERHKKVDSIVYIWYDYESIIKYDIVNKKVQPFPKAIEKYTTIAAEIHNIYIDQKNRLWISSGKYGLILYSLDHQKLIPIRNGNEFVGKLVVKDISEDRQNRIWINTFYNFYIYDESANEPKAKSKINALLNCAANHQYIDAPVFDAQQNLWVKKSNFKNNEEQFIKIDLHHESLVEFQKTKKDIFERLGKIESYNIIDDSLLFVSGIKAIAYFNIHQNFKPHIITEYNKIWTGGTRTFMKGNDHDVWIGYGAGAIKYNYHSNVLTRFTASNSALWQTVLLYFYKSLHEKRIYLFQKNFYYTIDLEAMRVSPKHQVKLSALKINNIKQHILPLSGETLHISYKDNPIEFTFYNSNFTNSEEDIFQYKLDDASSEWLNLDKNRLTFQGLGHGNYTLYIRTINSFGLVSIKNYVIHLQVHPPFWKTWWFTALLVLTSSLAIYLIFKYREQQRMQLEKVRFRIARDLHDDLGSNLSQIKHLAEIESYKNKNSTYSDITNKLTSVMQSMSEIVWSINPKYDNIEDVIQRIQEFSIDTLEPTGIHLKFDIADLHIKRKLNAENKRNYYLIFKEAINNILKYANAKNVVFKVYIENSLLVTAIADDGIGFDTALIKSGNGLRNMRERAKAMEAKIEISTSAEGTAVVLKF